MVKDHDVRRAGELPDPAEPDQVWRLDLICELALLISEAAGEPPLSTESQYEAEFRRLKAKLIKRDQAIESLKGEVRSQKEELTALRDQFVETVTELRAKLRKAEEQGFVS